MPWESPRSFKFFTYKLGIAPAVCTILTLYFNKNILIPVTSLFQGQELRKTFGDLKEHK
jgi:hypothetical protein